MLRASPGRFGRGATRRILMQSRFVRLALTAAVAATVAIVAAHRATPTTVMTASLGGAWPTLPASARGPLPVETLSVTYAPAVPAPILRRTSAKLVVNLETKEVTKRLSDGVEYTFWTFGGSVPGPMIRIREGDEVEFHLNNHPTSKMPHNIDLHAVTGPGGGAASSFTAPGHSSQFSFTALNAGLYVYHCATAPVGMHIANGMYGLILVEPKAGLAPVDHEYYVLQSEFYTMGKHGEEGLQSFSMEKALQENPDYVVFNGSEGALVGDNALRAKVGETVRLFVGNGGPNLVSSFHVIGEIFDRIYTEGGTIANQVNGQTTLVPAGGSAIVEFTLDTSGTYLMVDHSIFRTFNKGSLGMLKVEGDQVHEIYSGKELDEIYLGDESVASAVRKGAGGPPAQPTVTGGQPDGKAIFEKNCSMCHQTAGEGLEGVFPPLAKSDFLMARAKSSDRSELVGLIVNGKTGALTVNGKEYNGVMTPVSGLSDEDIAAVLTFITSNWGNAGAPPFSVDEVAKARASVSAKAP